MRMLAALLITMFAAAALAIEQADPSAAPPDRKAAAPAVDGSLPGPYQVLLTRSIFASGGKPEAGATAAAPPASPEAALSLKGVVQEDQQFTAFIEDVPARRTLELRVGDPVARGRIVGITLHELEYESAGRLTRVAIGQPLSGASAPTTGPAVEAPAAPTVVSTPQPRHSSGLAEAR